MLSESYYPVFRLEKLKTDAAISGAGEHNLRTKRPANADPARARDNKVLVGMGKTIPALVNNRIKECKITPRKNGVRAIEILQTAGPTFFTKLKSREAWIKDSIEFLWKTFGKENVVHVALHDDETTPHLHSIVVPVRKATYKKRKEVEWKLDAKGLFEQLADERERGPLDRSASEIRLSDITSAFRFIKKLADKQDPIALRLHEAMSPESRQSLSNRERRLTERSQILVKELNALLDKPAIFSDEFIGHVKLSEETLHLWKQNPTGDARHHLHRKILEDTFPKLITKCEGRRRGNPTSPFLHHLQVTYYELCEKLDKGISAPKYYGRASHMSLKAYYSALEKAKNTPSQKFAIRVNPPPSWDKSVDPADHAAKETERIDELIDLLRAEATEGHVRSQEAEELKLAIRNINEAHERKMQQSRAENTALKIENNRLATENKSLLNQMRTIPLTDILQKLGAQRSEFGTRNLFHLPDERVIQIAGPSFVELTGLRGRGSFQNRNRAKGAVDLVMFVTGWALRPTLKWLQDNFDLESTLNSEAERVKENLPGFLKPDLKTMELHEIKLHENSVHTTDALKWPEVSKALVEDYSLDPLVLKELNSKNSIGANTYGSLVCNKLNRTTLVGAIVLGLKPNPVTKAVYRSEYKAPDYPFIIGDPAAEITAIVATPLEAIAYFELSGRQSRVLATQSPLPPGIWLDFKNRPRAANQPILLAHDLTAHGQNLAKQLEVQLSEVGIPTQRDNPPQYHPNATGWCDLVKTANGKIAALPGLTVETARQAREDFKNRCAERIAQVTAKSQIWER